MPSVSSAGGRTQPRPRVMRVRVAVARARTIDAVARGAMSVSHDGYQHNMSMRII